MFGKGVLWCFGRGRGWGLGTLHLRGWDGNRVVSVGGSIMDG